MNVLQIIGLCLMAPLTISAIASICLFVVEEIKKDAIVAIPCIMVIMAVAGAVLLIQGV